MQPADFNRTIPMSKMTHTQACQASFNIVDMNLYPIATIKHFPMYTLISVSLTFSD